MPENLSPQTAEPEETGGKLEQRSASREDTRALIPVLEGESSLPQVLLSERLGSIGQGGIKGQAGSVLLQTAVAHIESEKSQLRSERDAAIQKADLYKDRYYEEKQKAAVFRSERDAAKAQVRLRTILVSTGSVIGGYGLRALSEATTQPWAWPAVVVGCLMLLAGWLLPDPPQQAGKE